MQGLRVSLEASPTATKNMHHNFLYHNSLEHNKITTENMHHNFLYHNNPEHRQTTTENMYHNFLYHNSLKDPNFLRNKRAMIMSVRCLLCKCMTVHEGMCRVIQLNMCRVSRCLCKCQTMLSWKRVRASCISLPVAGSTAIASFTSNQGLASDQFHQALSESSVHHSPSR